jgi:UDP-N-acetylmuramoylalanine--D-glutamate ligase
MNPRITSMENLIASDPGGRNVFALVVPDQLRLAAASLLARHGHRICISDQRSVALEEGLIVAGVETGGHTIRFLSQCGLVVASPGVRPDAPILAELHARGVPVISELELAYQLCPYPLIAVTGTRGKRSTIELVQRSFARAGHTLTIGGNRGRPLSALLLDLAGEPRPLSERGAGKRADAPDINGPHDLSASGHEPSAPIDHRPASGETTANPYVALAVSSFQLESIVHFRPHIAAILNLQEDHLDRHLSMPEYARIKARIFMNHRPDDMLILPYDDPRLRALARKHHGRTFFISTRQPLDRGAWLEGDRICMNIDGCVETLSQPDWEPGCAETVDPNKRESPATAGVPFPENLLAAVLMARLGLR